ncbi:MAG: phage portal protein [Blastocatellia bacterium]
MKEHIEESIHNFRSVNARYAKTERYYRGDHDLTFATEKFANAFGSLFREFAMNLCPAICDAVRDRLKITGFSVESSGNSDGFGSPAVLGGVAAFRGRGGESGMSAKHENGTGLSTPLRESVQVGSLRSDIDRVWQQNRMAVRSGEVHKEALKAGDAYVIVWPGADGRAAIYPNGASVCTVVYDDESPGQILWAAKFWRTLDRNTRLNLFYPDRIERYVSRSRTEGSLPDAKEFVSFTDPLSEIQNPKSEIQNPFGIVPVFHFANNADIGSFGCSELDAAMPVQDGMNKSVLDMLVAMEYSSYRQRWAAGIEIEYDNEGNAVAPFKAGVDHLWISQNADAKFGDFETANLEQFLKVKDSFRVDLASVTGTPLHYLLPQGRGSHSGEALRKAETRFVSKVRDRQAAFGQTWADVMAFAMLIDGCEGVRLTTNWEDPARLSERESLENILLKKEIGITTEQALKEAGYGTVDVESMSETA